MKKSIIAMVALFLMNNAMGMGALPQGVSPQSNYGRFLIGFSRPVVTANNMIESAWVTGAVEALRNDGVNVNLTDPSLATQLWYAIVGQIDYYASLPANRNNPSFKQRLWESLTRNLDELSRSSQSMQRQQWQGASPSQSNAQAQFIGQQRTTQVQARPMLSSQATREREGIANLARFIASRKTISPDFIYRDGIVTHMIMNDCLKAVLNGLPLTDANRRNVQGEIAGSLQNLIGDMLPKYPQTSLEKRQEILESVRQQVIHFINQKPSNTTY